MVLDHEVEVLNDVIAMSVAFVPDAEMNILTAAFDNPVFHFRSRPLASHELTQQFHFFFSEFSTELVWCIRIRVRASLRVLSLGSLVLVGVVAVMQGGKVEEAVNLAENVAGNRGLISRGSDPGSNVVTQVTGLLDQELRLLQHSGQASSFCRFGDGVVSLLGEVVRQ